MNGCIFCGRKPTTREHAIPRWAAEVVSEYWPRWVGSEGIIEQKRVSDQGTHSVHSVETPSGALSIVVRVVCTACNNGWMSDLETSVEPLVRRLIVGKAVDLPADRHEQLATWSVKTMMLLQFLHPERQPVPSEHHHLFRRDLRPPPQYTVHFGAYFGKRRPSVFVNWRRKIETENTGRLPDGATNAYLTTFSVGHLVVQVSGHTLTEPIYTVPADPLTRYLLPIWPSALLRWPPVERLDDSTLGQFVNLPAEPGYGISDELL